MFELLLQSLSSTHIEGDHAVLDGTVRDLPLPRKTDATIGRQDFALRNGRATMETRPGRRRWRLATHDRIEEIEFAAPCPTLNAWDYMAVSERIK